MLLSKRARSGYMYVYEEKSLAKRKQPQWYVKYKGIRGYDYFATPFEAAKHLYTLTSDDSTCSHPKLPRILGVHRDNASPIESWWKKKHITNNELKRMSLFGIRIEMTLKRAKMQGTVRAYLPASREHHIVFDNHTRGAFDLLRNKQWIRIPWQGNYLDDNAECGEVSSNETDDWTTQLFGPECPRCAVELGVGIQAWSRCVRCRHNEPGAMLPSSIG